MEKQVVIDINDPRSGKIAEALANPTCKKILNLLAENELSGTEIANKLKLPLNTVGYNVDKLIESGLIERTSKVLWSVKGKQIPKYKIANKKIVISPRALTSSGIIPAIVGSLILTAGIKYFSGMQSAIVSNEPITYTSGGSGGIANVADVATKVASGFMPPIPRPEIIQTCSDPHIWAWFLLGSLVAILIFLVWNLIIKMKGGNLE